jgi:hypothetical protein
LAVTVFATVFGDPVINMLVHVLLHALSAAGKESHTLS